MLNQAAFTARVRETRALVGIVLCAALFAACSREAPKAPPPPPPKVSVLTIEPKDVPIVPVYVAQTQSSQAVNIQARVSGFLDKRVYVEGSVVKAGQTLFQMDKRPFQAQVDAAAAAVQRQQAAMDVAKSNLARTKPLAEQNALSQKDLDDATGQYQQTAAAVEQAKAQLEEAKLNLSYTTIQSPVDGVSSYAVVADGTYLSPTNSLLTTVSVLTPMWVNFSISENDFERIRNQVRAGTLRFPDGGLFIVEIEMVDGSIFPSTGKITFANPSYNATTGTFLLRASVSNPNGLLRPNQYVRARLVGASHPNAIVVPQRAVQQGAKGHFCWVINKQDEAEVRPITVGDWKGENWLVPEGLQPGDRVVVDGSQRLTAGAKVQTAPYTPPATPAGPMYGGDTKSAGAPGSKAPPGVLGASNMANSISARGTPGASTTPGGPGAPSTAVYFARGQATLDPAAITQIRTAAAAYMGVGTKLSVVGYVDPSGDYAANVALAKKRAEAVRDELVRLGVDSRRIQVTVPSNFVGGSNDDQARRVDITSGS
jgi:membrane fusion protein (multidrug efflux system)